MGTSRPKIYSDGETPARRVSLKAYYLDRYEVSNDDFLNFIKSESNDDKEYKTEAERFGWSFVFRDLVPSELLASLEHAVAGAEWWIVVPGATWRSPEGPGSDVFDSGRGREPVVHVSWNDAVDFCRWRDARLPTEAEWERAARGDLAKQVFPWGNKIQEPKGTHRANIFHGSFPYHNSGDDGFKYLAPVDAFGPQNEYGLYNMIGNAWEWVHDAWTNYHEPADDDHPIVNPSGPINRNHNEGNEERTKRGGSYLCHKSYCYRYRNAARHHTSADSTTSHGGFRCARDVEV